MAHPDDTLDAYIIFLGASNVGKSCYTHFLELNAPAGLDQRPPATVGVSFRFFHRTQRAREYSTVRFVLVDTAGQDMFRKTLPSTLRKAEVVVYLFDLTERASFDALRSRFWPEVQQHCPNLRVSIVIGNKADLVGGPNDPSRKVSREEAEAFAKEVGALEYFERSALYDASSDVFWPIDKCALRLAEIGPPEKYRRQPKPILLHAASAKRAPNALIIDTGTDASSAGASGCCGSS